MNRFSGPFLAVALLGCAVTIVGLADITTAQGQTPPPEPTVQFATSEYTVNETGETVTITVTLSSASDQVVNVDYATSDGTATAPNDYDAATGTLTFNPGETSQTFTVTIHTDTEEDGDETVNLTLSNAQNATLGTPSTAVLTILDVPPPVVEFAEIEYVVNENMGLATITVILSEPSSETITVDYVTEDYSATAPDDYSAISGTLVFEPGQTSQTFQVTIHDDLLEEGPEYVILTLSNPSNAVLGVVNQAVLTIVDDEYNAVCPVE